MADRVDLTELDVISRYSLAVRSATADRDELVAALRADLAWLERPGAGSATGDAPRQRSSRRSPTAGAAPGAGSTRPAKRNTGGRGR
jgi:hypothetical protein